MYWRSLENRCFLFVLIFGLVVTFLSLYTSDESVHFLDRLRIVTFNVISIATTTGYATYDYGQWPPIAFSIMLLLSCFSTSSGSTGGGVKMIRVIIMFKQAGRELSRTMHPHAIIPLSIGETTVANKVVLAVLAFMFFYIVTLLATLFLLMATGLSAGTALSASLACLNNLGPALFELGPTSNYGSLSEVQLLILSLAMLLGRLELLTIFVFFSGAFWKK
jgi:trk system potassium uptake protein TrkH